ncbi:MAG: hypothetical protein DRG39_01155 [Deltaproteobacteria bacterium]|nr:MAG: hypothetical protein DRG39_01155 [Deltaproteobacteria bacterium]
MNPGIYFDTLNGIVRQKELAVISQNLSNLSTPGYKRDRVAFSRYLFSVIGNKRTDFSEGDLQPTNNPFDVAISGSEDAFFVVKTPDGKELYTRRGDFFLDKDKKLVTRNGFYVQGEKGDIIVKGDRFQINEDGNIVQNGKTIDKLKIVSLPLDKIKKYGRSLFYLTEELPVSSSSDYKIFQGYLESSNVKPVEEVAQMVNCLRNYEICKKSIQSQDETTSRLINDVGMVRV